MQIFHNTHKLPKGERLVLEQPNYAASSRPPALGASTAKSIPAVVVDGCSCSYCSDRKSSHRSVSKKYKDIKPNHRCLLSEYLYCTNGMPEDLYC